MSLEVTFMRNTNVICTVKPDGTSSQQKVIMGANTVTMTFELNRIVNFQIGDTVDIFSETYYVTTMPQVEKGSKFDYKYSMTVEGSQFQLERSQFMFYDQNNELRDSDFSLTGKPDVFIDLIIKNISRVTGEVWTRGSAIISEAKTISFSEQNCAQALATIAQTFGTEYFIQDNKISLQQLQNHTPFLFKNGSNKGLYTITRKQADGTSLITRLYAFGSSKNLPPDYPSTRLRLPGGYTNLAHNISWTVKTPDVPVTGGLIGFGLLSYVKEVDFTFDYPTSPTVTKVVFERRIKGNTATLDTETTTGTIAVSVDNRYMNEVRVLSEDIDGNVLSATQFFDVSGEVNPVPTAPIFTSDTALPYLEENKEVYGIIEGNYIDEDIYPHRTGIVTNVQDVYSFTDNTLDFDINAQLINTRAKITFNSGQLAGYTFDVAKYDNAIRQITILKNKDEANLDVPSEALKPAIGDEYVVTDIEMPLSYVQAAEALLQAKAQAFIDQYSSPVYQYSIECDPKYFRANQIKMNLGDLVFISDSELSIEKYIRVISNTKSLIDEYQYNLELGDVVPVGKFQQLQSSSQSNSNAISGLNNTVSNNAILNGNIICPQATDLTGLKPLYVDSDGKVFHG
jgi:hypothetical protein